MNRDIALSITSLSVLAINCVTLFRLFPSRFKLRYSVLSVVLFTVAIYVYLFVSAPIVSYAGLRGMFYFPLLLWLLKGQFFQKLFAMNMVLALTVSLLSLTEEAVKLFMPVGSDEYYLVKVVATLIMCAVYVVLVFKFGWRFVDKLFASGRSREWALYAFGGIFSYIILAFSLIMVENTALRISLTIFILWSFFLLCFAIINTHEKTKQKSDAEFARSMVASGRDHYQKMDTMYEKLRILRHDYKHHLNAVRRMISSGSLEEADRYLTVVENGLSEYEMQSYCANSVLNALIAGFADRCAKLNIKLDVKLDIPEQLSVAEYDMCIVLGNLLENAVEACEKQKADRAVEFVVKPQGTQLVIVTRNSFDGYITQVDDMPVSTKKDGGLGLKSVQAVAARYGGELLTEWDDKTFTAYVYMI